MADIAKVKAFAYKSVFKKKDIIYYNDGKMVWTAPWYSYLFQDESGNCWYLTQSELDCLIECGHIRVTEMAE